MSLRGGRTPAPMLFRGPDDVCPKGVSNLLLVTEFVGRDTLPLTGTFGEYDVEERQIAGMRNTIPHTGI